MPGTGKSVSQVYDCYLQMIQSKQRHDNLTDSGRNVKTNTHFARTNAVNYFQNGQIQLDKVILNVNIGANR